MENERARGERDGEGRVSRRNGSVPGTHRRYYYYYFFWLIFFSIRSQKGNLQADLRLVFSRKSSPCVFALPGRGVEWVGDRRAGGKQPARPLTLQQVRRLEPRALCRRGFTRGAAGTPPPADTLSPARDGATRPVLPSCAWSQSRPATEGLQIKLGGRFPTQTT